MTPAGEDVHVIGLALHEPQTRNTSERLEEIVWRTTRAALADAGVTRAAVDLLVIGACDELDGRSISSMLLAAPAGGYLKDEIKVTDSGAMAFCLGVARILSGEFELGIVASWCKPSKTDVESALAFGAEPFSKRPMGLSRGVADALLAQAVTERWAIEESEISRRVAAAYERAAGNPRGMGHTPPSAAEVAASPLLATPLRELHRAPLSDGAVTLILASGDWLRRHPDARSLARVRGVGWGIGSYRLHAERLQGVGGLLPAWEMALRQSDARGEGRPELFELDSQTGYHEAALVRALEVGDAAVSPSGGPFAQNPYFCAGLVNIAECALQVAGAAGAVQVPGVRVAVGHGVHGFAAQGHVFAVLEACA
jgi:acetyl-CoA C-acetyltransferase